MTERKNYDLAEMKDNDLAKKMSSDEGYKYAFHQDKNGKKGNENLSCEVCAESAPIFFELTRTDTEGTEAVLEGKFCSHTCCAFAYLERATTEDKHAAKQIKTSIKTRIKTLKNVEGSTQAKTLQELQNSEITRHILGLIGEDMKKDQPEKQRIAKFLSDVEKQGFIVTNKEGGDSCGDCHYKLEIEKDFHQTTLAIEDSSSSSGKHFATVAHCGKLDCLIANMMKIAELEAMPQQDKPATSEEDKQNPVFRLRSITKTWETATMNNKNKAWLQKSLNQIEEIDNLVQEHEKRIIENESSTDEDITKIGVAVKLARELRDKLSALKRKTVGDMSQRANMNKNFRNKVTEITTIFDSLKDNLEETEEDRVLRAKNDELQTTQNLSNKMTETIARLKMEAAELAKNTAFNRIQKLEQITNAIEMKAIADAKNIVSEHRHTSDAKILMQTQLAVEVTAVAHKLNELGFTWLQLPTDQTISNAVLLDPLGKDTMDALMALTNMTSKMVQAKVEQRVAKKQLLQIKLDAEESLKKEEKDSNERQKDNNKTAETEIEKLRKENETLKQQAAKDSNEIAEKKARIALLEKTVENNNKEIATLNATINETNQVMETLLENNGKIDDTTQSKKQKRGDKGSDDDMKNNEGKKSKKDGERKVQFDGSMQTQLDSNPGTPNYSPDRSAATPPKQRRGIDNSDPSEPQYSPGSEQQAPDEDKMPDLDLGQNSQSSTTNPAIEKSRSLLERMRKSGAPEDNNWQNVEKRNTSKRDLRDQRDQRNQRDQRDQRNEKSRETDIERHPNPMYGGNYGTPQMPQWGPQPGPMAPQWMPPPPGWAAWPPGWAPQEGQYGAQPPHFHPMPPNERSDRGNNERSDRGNNDRNDRNIRSDRNDDRQDRGNGERTDRNIRSDRNDDRNDRDQPRNGRFDKRDCNYWLADQDCPRGDACNFLHVPNKRGTQMNALVRFREYQDKVRNPPRKD